MRKETGLHQGHGSSPALFSLAVEHVVLRPFDTECTRRGWEFQIADLRIARMTWADDNVLTARTADELAAMLGLLEDLIRAVGCELRQNSLDPSCRRAEAVRRSAREVVDVRSHRQSNCAWGEGARRRAADRGDTPDPCGLGSLRAQPAIADVAFGSAHTNNPISGLCPQLPVVVSHGLGADPRAHSVSTRGRTKLGQTTTNGDGPFAMPCDGLPVHNLGTRL